jgi:hypothetical protein
LAGWISLWIIAAACGQADPVGAIPSTRDAGGLDDGAQVDRGFVVDAPAANDTTASMDTGAVGPDVASWPDGPADDGPPREAGPTGPLTIESLQVIGTHNSYHRAPAIAFDASHKYTHLPLDQQFDGGVRAIELDLHLRTDGGYDVYHIAVIDPNTTCATFDVCLGVVSTWSDAHPRHAPIFIWLELKDDTGGQPIKDVVPIEAVIQKVFPPEKIITAAWLKGTYASPHARILAAGWPTLEEARGKVMFGIINRDDRTKAYSHDFTSLDDRIMFVNAAPDQLDMPWAALTKVDDVTPTDAVMNAHAAHLVVGVNVCAVNMADADCQVRLTTAISTGIHLLQDDLPFPVQGRTYSAKLPGGSPGCNPVTAPPGCQSSWIE